MFAPSLVTWISSPISRNARELTAERGVLPEGVDRQLGQGAHALLPPVVANHESGGKHGDNRRHVEPLANRNDP